MLLFFGYHIRQYLSEPNKIVNAAAWLDAFLSKDASNQIQNVVLVGG